MKNIITLIDTIAKINPNINFLAVNFMLPFFTPLKSKIDISNMRKKNGVDTISPQFS